MFVTQPKGKWRTQRANAFLLFVRYFFAEWGGRRVGVKGVRWDNDTKLTGGVDASAPAALSVGVWRVGGCVVQQRGCLESMCVGEKVFHGTRSTSNARVRVEASVVFQKALLSFFAFNVSRNLLLFLLVCLMHVGFYRQRGRRRSNYVATEFPWLLDTNSSRYINGLSQKPHSTSSKKHEIIILRITT